MNPQNSQPILSEGEIKQRKGVHSMRKLIEVFVMCLGSALTITTARSQVTTPVSVDEYGNSVYNGFRGPQGSIAQDPISGLFTLCYNLPLGGLDPGDVVLTNSDTGQISDILRFEVTPGLTYRLYFFSDSTNEPPEPGVLADGPLPQIMSPSVFFAEVGPETGPAGLNYAPSGGLPGTASEGATYYFCSEGQIPEPGSFALVITGGLVALIRRSRVRNSPPSNYSARSRKERCQEKQFPADGAG
jgi:hypothetical protein